MTFKKIVFGCKKYGVIILMCCMMSACQTMYDMTSDNRENMFYLSLGMTREDVHEVMGTKKRTAYYSKPLTITTREPETQYFFLTRKKSFSSVANPYKSETIVFANQQYLVDYYATGVSETDCEVQAEDLTPIVYQRNVLIGWGEEFLYELAH